MALTPLDNDVDGRSSTFIALKDAESCGDWTDGKSGSIAAG